MSKKIIGWITGSIVVLGISGYVLARYNTNSMAHVVYQRVMHTNKNSASSLKSGHSAAVVNDVTPKSKKQPSLLNQKEVQKELIDKGYTGAYATVENGKISPTSFVGKNANQMNGKFYLATNTENMLTAAAVLHLINQGKLRLSTPINQYFNSLAISNNVTVQTLLNMTSGLSNNSIPSNQLANVLDWNVNHVHSGTVGQYNYQEVNYVLLEGIISQIANQSYQEYINNTFLRPNGLLNDVKFVSQIDDNNLATPYNGGQPVANTDLAKAMNSQMGKNQLVTTPEGLLKLTKVLIKQYGNDPNFSGSQPTGRLIKESNMYYVSGGIVGYQASVAISQDSSKGVVLMSNDSNGKENLTSLVKDIYNKLK